MPCDTHIKHIAARLCPWVFPDRMGSELLGSFFQGWGPAFLPPQLAILQGPGEHKPSPGGWRHTCPAGPPRGPERPPPRIQEAPAFKYTPTPSPSSRQLPPPDVVLPSPSGHRTGTPGLAAAERHVETSVPTQTEVSGQASPASKLSYAAQASASIVFPSQLLC